MSETRSGRVGAARRRYGLWARQSKWAPLRL